MKLIIGLAGQQGAGKTEVCKFLQERFQKSCEIIKVSDVLKETLKLWNLPIDAKNMQLISDFMKNTFGVETLSNVLENNINRSTADVIIVDGVRGKQVFKVLKSYENSYIIFLKSEKSTRFGRILKRNEKDNEKYMDENIFEQLELHRTEANTLDIEKISDYVLENNETVENLKIKIKEILNEIKF
jgi:dephospho-CoA kinase